MLDLVVRAQSPRVVVGRHADGRMLADGDVDPYVRCRCSPIKQVGFHGNLLCRCPQPAESCQQHRCKKFLHHICFVE